MSSYKKIDLEREFAAGGYLSEAQNPIPNTLYTLNACTVYRYSFTQGRGEGGELNQREGESFTGQFFI
jgi:hypothetical protein